MGIGSSVRWLFRAITRIACYGFLFTLPVTFFPLLLGIEGGITFFLWSQAQVWSSIESLTFELEFKQSMDYWNVPGAMTIREFRDQSAPFFIPSISSEDWTHKLSITKPEEHFDPVNSKIDMLGTLDGIMRYPLGECADSPTEMWVYVTDWAMPDFMPWDQAFDRVLQEMHANPLPSNTSIHYLHCGASNFMCTVWSVKAPSLVLLTVDDTQAALSPSESGELDSQPGFWQNIADSMEPEYTYSVPEADLLPITPRVIELPLENTSWLLPSTTFPTEYAQLSTLFSLDLETLKARFEPYSAVTQLLRRYDDHQFNLRNQRYPRRTVQWWIAKAWDLYDDYVLGPVLEMTGTEDAYADYISTPIFNLALILTGVVAALVHVPCRWIWAAYAWYMGLSITGKPIEMQSLGDGVVENGGNWMNDMMSDFWSVVMQNISDQQVKEKMKAAMTDFA